MPETTIVSQGATDPQMGFITTLVQQRVVPDDLLAQMTSEVLTKATASQFIGLLKGLPYKTSAGRASFVPTSVANEVPEGTYTVVRGDDYVTLRLAREAWCDGKVVVSYLCGSDNDYSYKAFAFATPTGIRPFRAFRDNTRLVGAAEALLVTPLADAREAFLQQAETYALKSGKCLNCLHTLTVPASLCRGLGPVCARRLGVL